MLECLAFKASKHRDTLRIMKEVCSMQLAWWQMSLQGVQ
jgi:hypothetical protein